jgi:hypothetical protein
MPFGTIVLSITFGNLVHYHKETLSFEVVYFEGPYHAIVRRPCDAKFVVIPTTSSSRRHACVASLQYLATFRMPMNAIGSLSCRLTPSSILRKQG